MRGTHGHWPSHQPACLYIPSVHGRRLVHGISLTAEIAEESVAAENPGTRTMPAHLRCTPTFMRDAFPPAARTARRVLLGFFFFTPWAGWAVCTNHLRTMAVPVVRAYRASINSTQIKSKILRTSCATSNASCQSQSKKRSATWPLSRTCKSHRYD